MRWQRLRDAEPSLGATSSTRYSPFVNLKLVSEEERALAQHCVRSVDQTLGLALDAARAGRLARPVARPIQTRVAGVLAARVSESEQPFPASTPRRRTRTGSIRRCDELCQCARRSFGKGKGKERERRRAATHAKRCSTFNLEGTAAESRISMTGRASSSERSHTLLAHISPRCARPQIARSSGRKHARTSEPTRGQSGWQAPGE
ncbi:hypothetical protein GY45DRAFT_140184 [Cubamyces sp. BRFM 1775]|nr:hypothetical protein GY45DRAFT_140184 [Cubamyces sp. BRFM 1775]